MNIIIVGNSPDLLQQKNGELIDSFDYVLRMNEFETDGFEDYVGARTDIYGVAWATPKKKDFASFDHVIYYTGPHNFYKYKRAHNVDVIGIKDYDLMNKDMDFDDVLTQPSMGISMIWYLLKYYPNFEMTITGFDFFGLKHNHHEAGHYYSQERYPYERFLINHNPQKEMNYVNNLIKENKITQL